MIQQVTVDADGELYVNRGAFPFVDPTNGVRFEPQVHVKVKVTKWMQDQPVIVKVEDEKPVEAKAAEAEKPAKK